MNYKDYAVSRNLAWEILIREKVTSLPVRIVRLCAQMGVPVRYGAPGVMGDGYSAVVAGTPHIILKPGLPQTRTRFTAAHELGHILLGHLGDCTLVNREPSPSDNPVEAAANVFASRLLAPSCVLWGCGVTTADQIAELCGIGFQAATLRMERMEVLYARNRFLQSALEREVYAQFYDFILSHRLPGSSAPTTP